MATKKNAEGKVIPISAAQKKVNPIKLKVSLENTPIEIYRKILVPEKINMMQLHFVIQIAMGWQMSHLFDFRNRRMNPDILIQLPVEDFEPDMFGDDTELFLPEKALLANIFDDVLERKPFYYTYDFGDNWEHKITFQKPSIPDLSVFTGQPLLVEATGSCPPEDVGGLWGFENFLDAINNKKHPEYEDFREWLGLGKKEVYDEGLVDLDGINEALMQLPSSPFWKMTSKKFFN